MPVERAIIKSVPSWEYERESKDDPAPKRNTAAKAIREVMRNRNPVVNDAGWFVRAIFENVVEDPQQKAAPIAKSAALIVPVPVEKFTAPLGKVTKYADTRATKAQAKYP